MNKILQVAAREYRETVKTRSFLITLLITPVMIILLAIISDWAGKNAAKGAQPVRTVAVVDRSGQLMAEIEQSFKKFNNSLPQRPINVRIDREGTPDQRVERFKKQIETGEISACVDIPASVVAETSATPVVQYFSKTKSIGDMELFGSVQHQVNESVTNWRYARHGLSKELIAQLNRPVVLQQVELGQKQQAERGRPSMARVMVPFFFMFLMFMGLVTTSQWMLLSVIEEKNSRVIEVLLAAISPFQLMAGKILGLAAVGFTIMAIWGVTGLWGVAHYFGLGSIGSAGLMAWLVIYYVFGYLLIASVNAAIGSACNTIKEAQNMVMPVTTAIVLPIMFWAPITQNPNGTLATVLALFPPTTPMVMVLRLSVQPDLPMVQIIGSLVLLIAATWATFWAAGKIFRVGILMYGKPPSPREILRWVRFR